MSERNDGGNAYPTGQWEYDGQGQVLPYQEPGMSLRDAMAISAAGHIWAQFQTDGTARQCPEWRHGVAVEAYRLADEMLAAREGS